MKRLPTAQRPMPTRGKREHICTQTHKSVNQTRVNMLRALSTFTPVYKQAEGHCAWEEVIGDCEMERMRGEDTYNSRLRKDWRRGEGCWRVKGLSTGHPLYRGRPRRTAFFFYGVGACCTWTDTKEGQAAGGQSTKINIKACWPCPAFVAWIWQAPAQGWTRWEGKGGWGGRGLQNETCSFSSLPNFLWINQTVL